VSGCSAPGRPRWRGGATLLLTIFFCWRWCSVCGWLPSSGGLALWWRKVVVKLVLCSMPPDLGSSSPAASAACSVARPESEDERHPLPLLPMAEQASLPLPTPSGLFPWWWGGGRCSVASPVAWSEPRTRSRSQLVARSFLHICRVFAIILFPLRSSL
jgi:hypothetical protein